LSTPADKGFQAAAQDNAQAAREAAAAVNSDPQTGGPLDPLNLWTVAELDRWAAAALNQQRALVRQAIRLFEKQEYKLLHRTLLLQAHWFGVSEQIQQLRIEMQR
jgi:hypothetical protein